MNHIESAKPKKLYDINVLRTLSIIGVVFFHAYGMMYATHFQSVADMYRQTYSTCLEVLLGFRMPVLIFSSGFLYSYLLGRGKYKDTSRYVYHKFKRLIIPYFVFATIYSLVFMHDLDIATIIKGNLAHLWFITMLFWCFCAIRLFSFGTADNQQSTINNQQLLYECGVLAVSFFLMFCPWELSTFMGIHNLPKWFFWFYLGYAVQLHSNSLKLFIKRYYGFILFPTIYLICMYFTVHEPKITGQKTFSGQIGYLAAALWCWYSVNWLLERFGAGFAQSKLFSELTMCSYGIYVFHNMLEPLMISRTAQQLLPLEQWAADHIILFPLVFSLLALLLSYIVTRIFLMTRIGKFLVG